MVFDRFDSIFLKGQQLVKTIIKQLQIVDSHSTSPYHLLESIKIKRRSTIGQSIFIYLVFGEILILAKY